MFILTKPILVSLCVRRTGYLFIAQINSKKIILSLNKLACMYACCGRKLGWKCSGIAHLLPGTASEERKEGSQVSLSSCLSIPDVLLFQALMTCCWCLPHDVALSNNPCMQLCLYPHHKSVKSWQSSGGNESLGIKTWLVVVLSMVKKLHTSEDHAFWINFQFAGFLSTPPSTCKN